MEKKFIAFAGGMNSGKPNTKQFAIEWARKHLANTAGSMHVFVCSIDTVIERAEPPITEKAFVPETPTDTAALKAA